MKTFYAFILLTLFSITKSKAQFVTIPDSTFRNFLMLQYPSCFNANQKMDTTCNEVVNEDILACEGVGISDLTGVQYFINVYDLNCNINSLTELPLLPPNLQTLWCANNSITKLTNLPASLLYLDCTANQIDTISNLPNNLLELDARLNSALINIQTLPNSLQLLDVSQGDNLIDISAISNSSLKKFYCNYNSIALMPSLPANLEKLSCSGNQLTALPTLPSTLDFLACSYNSLSSLPNLPNNLLQLRCSNNLITILPNLPNGILEIKCSNNLLDSLPFLPNSLIELICDNNSIEFLPLLPLNLYWLDCSSNDISNLPTLPPNLEQLYCSGNLLTSIPNLPTTIYTLKCASNNLYSLPSIPAGIDMIDILGNPNLHCLPQLPAMSIFWFNPANFTCMPNYANILQTSDTLTNFPLCDVFNTYGCSPYWNISGKTFVDNNSNCAQDNNEAGFQHIKMKLFENGNLLQQTLTNQAGQYSFNTNLGVYDIAVDTTNLPFSVSCPPLNTLQTAVTIADSMHYNQNFALNCKPGFDIGVTTIVQDSGRFKPANYVVVKARMGDISNLYGLNCASGVSGQVMITINGPTVFAGVPNNALIPSIQNNVLTYTIADFGAVDFYNDFQFRCLTDTNAAIGSTVCFDIMVTPINGDNNSNNNTLNYCFNVVNSYDPNDKLVYPAGTILPSQEYLTYTVNFQNTGNAAADHIYILDTISNFLDIESFEVLATSHTMQLQIINNMVRFNFANINLPDSTSNEPASHGYVQYRVKLKDNINIGDIVENTASIFFDFNPAIVTNTTLSEVGLLTTVNEDVSENVSVVVYPNPASDMLYLKFVNATKSNNVHVKVYNSMGALLLNFTSLNPKSIDIAALPVGLYVAEIGNKRVKFIKQ